MSSAAVRKNTVLLTTEYPERFRYYDMLVSAFVAVLLISNIVAPKIIEIGGFKLSGAQILFPLTYIFGDIFTEVYGYAGSRRAIWNGFFASILMTLVSSAVLALPAAADWPHQAAFATVLGTIPRLVFASLIAYWAGEFANSFIMARMKVLTGSRHLWARTVGSTAVGQAVDTVLVITIAFAGIWSADQIWEVIRNGYIAKVLYEVLATPITYLVVNVLKRAEGVDILDDHTDFNPFKAKIAAE